MSDIIIKYVGLAFSIFIFAASSANVFMLLNNASEPIVELGSDKTFVESTGVQKTYEQELYGSDILMMLLNTDAMTPYPRAIKINDTPVIKLDNSFITAKIRNTGNIYSPSGQWGLKNMLDWKVVSKKYVYDDPEGPYIHYELEEVL